MAYLKTILLLTMIGVVALGQTACEQGKSNEELLSATEMQRLEVSPEARNVLISAQRALDNGYLKQALILSDSALKKAPALSDAHFLRAQVLDRVKQYDEAEEAYKKTLELDPDYRIAKFNLGNIAFGREWFREALQYYLGTLEVDDLVDTVPADLPDDLKIPRQITALMQIGRTYSKLGDFEKALQTYLLAVKVDSMSAKVYSDLSVLTKDNGDFVKAATYARKAIELEPGNIEYAYFLGALLVQQAEHEQAIPILQRVIEEKPWQQGAHFNLGQALVRVGRTEEGQRMLAQADTVQQLQTEIDQLNAIVEVQSGVPDTWLKLGNAYSQAKRYREAIDVFNYLLQFVPNHTEAWYNMALAYRNLEENKPARKAVQYALKYDPTHERAQNLLDELSD